MSCLRAALAVVVLSIVACLLVSRPLLAEESTGEGLAERPISREEREHWSYQPLKQLDVPPAGADGRGTHPVDGFLRAAMDKNGVEPLPRAGRAVLLRRVYFDLTGLPPTPADLRDFLEDANPQAYEARVDRLLASSAYGERWAQHWLDVARFAETDGFEHDLVRPNAWRYRDWVIDAMNRDLPFDEFVRQQIAGDLLHPGDPQAAIATGFLLCGPDMPDLNLQEERRHVVLNEISATVGSVFLAMQFGWRSVTITSTIRSASTTFIGCARFSNRPIFFAIIRSPRRPNSRRGKPPRMPSTPNSSAPTSDAASSKRGAAIDFERRTPTCNRRTRNCWPNSPTTSGPNMPN